MTVFYKASLILIFAVFMITGTVLPAAASDKPVDSKQLKKTTITAHMEENIKTGNNIIFCNTFQLAWNSLTGDILKGDLLMENAAPLVGILNRMRRIVTGKDLSDKSYLAMAGFGSDNIVSKINKELKEKFGDEAWLVKEQLAPDDILAYAFLMKALKFKTQFDDSPGGLIFKGENRQDRVKAFGIQRFSSNNEKMQELSKQVDILYYEANKTKDTLPEFIVRLNSDSKNDELILAMIPPKKDLISTYQSAVSLMKESQRLSEGDILLIPEIDFFIEHSYDELLSKRILNKGFSDYFISKAIQATKFKLDKTGAQLKSKAVIIMTRSAAPSISIKRMVFDRPFLLIMREKNAKNPYFMIWVDNPEILLKS